tara:strand:- start:2527 stop:2889 length:363 start_codon:yes stop_codon:yes gene_type:complete
MKKWVLLKHSIDNLNLQNFHYDILFENYVDCLTWKFYEIPIINGPSIEIIKQNNHRLIWLSIESKVLSRGRGFAKRVDSGQFKIIENNFHKNDFSLELHGKFLSGIFQKKGNLLRLLSSN